MSKHWRPDDNVVRGRFGRRGAVRPSETGTGWLSPEAYRALSPEERRTLHHKRALARHARTYRPTPARYRKGMGATGHSAPVTATFTSCKCGGGTNCVVDGDTFYLNGEKVRIAGIDAPETHDYGCESELALGNQATDKLQALLNSGPVTMTSIDRDRDVYGRLLRDVQVNGAEEYDAWAAVTNRLAGSRTL